MRVLLPVLMTMLSVAAFAKPAHHPQPHAERNAALVTSETSQGAFVLGNPKAPARVYEYMSFTCPHCAAFIQEAAGELKAGYLANGAVAYEVRNAVRDRVDLTAALLARCGGRSRFFGNMEAILAAQYEWMASAPDVDAKVVGTKNPVAAFRRIANETGLIALMRKRGYTAQQLNQCLGDAAAQKKIDAMTTDAWDAHKIPGTPAFYLNDKLIVGNTWLDVNVALDSLKSASTSKPEVVK